MAAVHYRDANDAKVVLVTTRQYVAFASGLLGYGCASDDTAKEAKSKALSYCRKHAPLGTVKLRERNGPQR